MRLVELHIIQSFPVTCLNRDDVGAPKTAYFGGVQRARVSSQCWKRAIRLMAQELQRERGLTLFAGARTRRTIDDLAARLTEMNVDDNKARAMATTVCTGLLEKPTAEKESAKGSKKAPVADSKPADDTTSTLLYLSPAELTAIATAIAAKPDSEPKALIALATAAVPDAHLRDGADIAIFGRMVASAPSLTLEGAGLFSHALSTHRCDNDIDFFTAVDDHKRTGDDTGSAMMGSLEFSSACYYRYVGLNLDMLANPDHLESLSPEHRRSVSEIFLRAAVQAVPSARKNSMFGVNPPEYVLALKRSGQPLSLANAFESAIRADGGYVQPSIAALREQWQKLSTLYGLKVDAQSELPPDDIETLIGKLL